MMSNAHEDKPAIFHTRWAMSYLRGPLTRVQISKLMADKKKAATEGQGGRQRIRPRGCRIQGCAARPQRANSNRRRAASREGERAEPDWPTSAS